MKFRKLENCFSSQTDVKKFYESQSNRYAFMKILRTFAKSMVKVAVWRCKFECYLTLVDDVKRMRYNVNQAQSKQVIIIPSKTQIINDAQVSLAVFGINFNHKPFVNKLHNAFTNTFFHPIQPSN